MMCKLKQNDLTTYTDICTNVVGMTMTELNILVKLLGESSYRAKQIYNGLYSQRWTKWEQFSNLPKILRMKLNSRVALRWLDIYESSHSKDGATKYTFLLEDNSLIEGIYIPYSNRITMCLSSQVGCAMGCAFCATASMGIIRSLSVAEIVGQVVMMLNANNYIPTTPINLVFMGMGEPLNNLDRVMSAFNLLTDDDGLAIPPKRITVSTVGLVNEIRRLGNYVKRPRLALSLNATTDDCRSKIMPANNIWNLTALLAALKSFPLACGEHITIEYINDSLEDGKRLASFASQFPSKVNLIPFNSHNDSDFVATPEARINELCDILSSQNIITSVRRSRGQDIAGACGQMVRDKTDCSIKKQILN